MSVVSASPVLEAPPDVLREVVGVFDDMETLDNAAQDLQMQGFNRSHISILSGSRLAERMLSEGVGTTHELEDHPHAPRTVFVSKASLGDAEGALIGGITYLGAIAAAGASAGAGASVSEVVFAVAVAGAVCAGIGFGLAWWLQRRYSDAHRAAVAHGGVVLWVHTRSPVEEQKAAEILGRHGARNVHLHEIR
jgi:hypothetical protein